MSNELQSGVNNKPHLWLLLDCEDLGIQTRIEQEGIREKREYCLEEDFSKGLKCRSWW